MKPFLPLCALTLPLLGSLRSEARPLAALSPFATLSSAATPAAKKAPARAPKLSATERVHEALLRRIVPRGDKVCYLSLDGQDPSTAFVARMRQLKVPIEKMSRSPHPFKSGRGAGMNPEFMMRLKPLRWVTSRKVEVQCALRSIGILYTLEQKKGAWTVTDQKTLWMS